MIFKNMKNDKDSYGLENIFEIYHVEDYKLKVLPFETGDLFKHEIIHQ